MTVETTRASCPARVALAGNPSDGFGGAVFGAQLDSMRAEVVVSPADHLSITPTSTYSPIRLDGLADHIRANGVTGIEDLVLASIQRLDDHLGVELGPVAIAVNTDIPRSVGLAGSSAIIIATLRALVARHSPSVMLDPDVTSALALSVETDVLGLRAGLQDRVVQAYGAPVLMDFAPENVRLVDGFRVGTYEVVQPARRVEILVAARPSSAEPSEVPQRTLHEQRLNDPNTFRAAMSALASAARLAADAWARGDIDELGCQMDRSFRIRDSIMELRPDHTELIHAAHDVGCHANYSGSGGTITVVSAHSAARDRAATALAQRGCTVTSCAFGPPDDG